MASPPETYTAGHRRSPPQTHWHALAVLQLEGLAESEIFRLLFMLTSQHPAFISTEFDRKSVADCFDYCMHCFVQSRGVTLGLHLCRQPQSRSRIVFQITTNIHNDHYARDLPQGLLELILQMPHGDDDEQPPQQSPSPRVSQKKVRRVKRREKECGFCQGNDERNKEGVPETMLSCFICGRSGHPTCLCLDGIAETVFNYPWTCIECKACEICYDKGDDTKLLFCDNCDRGWHCDCLDPPLDVLLDGNWNCPLCPPLPKEEYN